MNNENIILVQFSNRSKLYETMIVIGVKASVLDNINILLVKV